MILYESPQQLIKPLNENIIDSNCRGLKILFFNLAQLQQKIDDIDMKLAAVGKHNGTKLRESENNERTNLGKHDSMHIISLALMSILLNSFL